tara:strand:- start:41 stop:385 length:345 start_codon:yes stop_codon:yes gene_type:complete
VQLLALLQVQLEDQLPSLLWNSRDAVEQLLGRRVTEEVGFLMEVIYDLVPLVFQYIDSGFEELLSTPVLLLDEADPVHQQLQFLNEHVEAILVDPELEHYMLGAPFHTVVGMDA